MSIFTTKHVRSLAEAHWEGLPLAKRSETTKEDVINNYTSGFHESLRLSDEIRISAKLLIIPKYQADRISEAFRVTANLLGSSSKITCLDRDLMQAWKTIQNVIEGNYNQPVHRF